MTRGPKSGKRVDSDSLRLARLRVGAAGRTVVLFLVFGILWIVITTAAGELFIHEVEDLAMFELIKGIVFVVLSSLIIYVSIAFHANRVLTSEIESIEKLKQSERTFETLVNGITDHLIVMLAANGTIRTWNRGAIEITGFDRDEMIGRQFETLFTEREKADGRPRSLLQSAREHGQVSAVGTRVRKDGSRFWVASTVAAICDDRGELICYAKIGRDLTETIEYETRLRRRSSQHAIIADLGERVLTNQDWDGLVRDAMARIGKGLDADRVLLLCRMDGKGDSIVSGWTRGSDEKDGSDIAPEEIRAIAETCSRFEVGLQIGFPPSGSLSRAGYKSGIAVHFTTAGSDWCLAALFRHDFTPHEDDGHFLAAIARILSNGIERRRYEKDLLDREAELSVLMHQFPAVLWTLDLELRLQSSRGALMSEMGLAQDENVGRLASDFTPPEIVEKLRSVLGGSSLTYRTEYLGRVFRNRAEPLRDNHGEIVGVVGVSLDWTEIEAQERELEESRRRIVEEHARLRLYLEQTPAVLWSVDRDLLIQEAAGRGLAALNAEPETSKGRSLSEVLGPDHIAVSEVRRVLATGETRNYSLEYNERRLRATVTPLRDRNGAIVGVLGLSLDVTDEWAQQNALEALSAQLMASQESERERIARELHDEFGGIFTALQFDVVWLKEHTKDPSVQARSDEMGKRIDHAMGEIRRVARQLRPQVIDDFGLVPALEDLVSDFSARYGIDADLSVQPDEMLARTPNDILLYRVVQEALTNVARHSGATRTEVRLRINDDHITTEIRDNGKGIARTDSNAGASLGLMGMRERADMMNGSFTIESYEGKGTVIRVQIPKVS